MRLSLCISNNKPVWGERKKPPQLNVGLHSTPSLSCMQTGRPNCTDICEQWDYCPPEASQQVTAGPAIGQESPPTTQAELACGLREDMSHDKTLIDQIQADMMALGQGGVRPRWPINQCFLLDILRVSFL